MALVDFEEAFERVLRAKKRPRVKVRNEPRPKVVLKRGKRRKRILAKPRTAPGT